MISQDGSVIVSVVDAVNLTRTVIPQGGLTDLSVVDAV